MMKFNVSASARWIEASTRSMPIASPIGDRVASWLAPKSPAASVPTTNGFGALPAWAPLGKREAASAAPRSRNVSRFMINRLRESFLEDAVRRGRGASCEEAPQIVRRRLRRGALELGSGRGQRPSGGLVERHRGGQHGRDLVD